MKNYLSIVQKTNKNIIVYYIKICYYLFRTFDIRMSDVTYGGTPNNTC